MGTHLHSILTVIALFFLGLISPGPKFLVVVEVTLKSGRFAGLVTGLGAAVGEAVYASLGLFGVTRLIAVGARMMTVVEVMGGLYLLWLGTGMLIRRMDARKPLVAGCGHAGGIHFWRGLLTDSGQSQNSHFLRQHFCCDRYSLHAANSSWGHAIRNRADVGFVAILSFGDVFYLLHTPGVMSGLDPRSNVSLV